MRYSRRHKEETHNRLLKKAAEEFRRSGVQGTGIAPLMGQLGLTHGGFYAHFDSKNELIAQATGPMFENGLAGRMLAAAGPALRHGRGGGGGDGGGPSPKSTDPLSTHFRLNKFALIPFPKLPPGHPVTY